MSDLFQDKAGDWDERPLPAKISAGVGKALLASVELHAQMRVMDFGAGTGLICAHVAPHVGRVYAVDISQAMLEQLAAKPELEGKVEPVCQNILETPLEKSFDLIISAMAMHHVEDTEKLARTFAQHLKPGSRIALADLDTEDGSFHPPETEGVFHHGFDRGALQGVLERCGFTDVEFKTALEATKEDRSYPIFFVTATKS